MGVCMRLKDYTGSLLQIHLVTVNILTGQFCNINLIPISALRKCPRRNKRSFSLYLAVSAPAFSTQRL